MNGNNYDHDKSLYFATKFAKKSTKKDSFPEPVIFTSKKFEGMNYLTLL